MFIPRKYSYKYHTNTGFEDEMVDANLINL